MGARRGWMWSVLAACMLAVFLVAGIAPAAASAEDDDLALSAQAVSVGAPRVVADSSMQSGQVVTWDCVWFGNYPQVEVAPGDAVYASLEAAGWDSNGDATVGGRSLPPNNEVRRHLQRLLVG